MNIFIDTNVFYNKGFRFQSKVFQAVISNANEDRMHLLTTDLQEKEMEKKINDWVDEHFSADKRLGKARKINITDDLKTSWGKLESAIKNHKQETVAQYLQDYEEFISNSFAQILNTSEVNTMSVFDSFFKKEAPFSTKKSDEFRDAFMLKRVQQYAHKTQEKVYIVSDDTDMKKFCENEELFEWYKNLESLLDDTIKDWYYQLQREQKFEEFYNALIDLIDSDEFQETTTEKVLDMDIEPDYFELLHDGTINDVSIQEVISGFDYSLINIHENSLEKDEPFSANISINVHLDVYFNVTEPDRDTVVRDSDTKELIYINEKDREWSQAIELPIVFEVIAEKEDEELIIKNISIVEVEFEAVGYIDSDDADSPY